jgi:uncharacterized membrane protein YoaK (UPF0700 family)
MVEYALVLVAFLALTLCLSALAGRLGEGVFAQLAEDAAAHSTGNLLQAVQDALCY